MEEHGNLRGQMKYLQLNVAGFLALFAGYYFYTGNYTPAYWNLIGALINIAIWYFAFYPLRELERRIVKLETRVAYLNAENDWFLKRTIK